MYLCTIIRKMRKQDMKAISKFFLSGLLLAAASCTSYKQVPYLQNSQHIHSEQAVELYDARIQPKDMLTITVSSENYESAIPYNLTVATVQSASTRYVTSQPTLQTYLVDNNGNIDFPGLGVLHVGGLTKSESEDMIKKQLSQFLKGNFIVNVRMVNYKISVLGEVARPNTYTVSNEKVNVFEALALAGDLTIYGKRDGVKLIREYADGTKEIALLNLNDANIIYSPHYYLQQNDILYVEPNKAKAQNSEIGSMTTLWFSATSILISLASLLSNVLKVKG